MPKPPRDTPKTGDSTPPASTVARLESLLGKLAPVPELWLKSSPIARKSGGGKDLECVPCSSYADLIESWREAMEWTDGLDCALSVMLAVVTSTKSVGDQLWAKVLGPPACGKSTLCEAVSVNPRFVVAKSTLKGFHSGWKGDGDGEDNSLIVQVKDKTLVTKDGDTLLKQPNLEQILAEARDLYDSVTRSYYKNKMGRDYVGIRMSWILCGTNSLRAIDSSELGERFLDCVIMESIDDDLEDEILWRVANRAYRNTSLESDGEAVTQYDPELATAMQLTGGYVEYLRVNAIELLSGVDSSTAALTKCTLLGKFVAYMRARPSKTHEEAESRELASRLVSQLVRLAQCLAVVLNRNSVDDVVMQRVTKVAMDTSRGDTLKIVTHLYAAEDGLEIRGLSLFTGRTEDKLRSLMRFLVRIGVVELGPKAEGKGMSNTRRFVLTARIRRLYEEVSNG